MKRTIDVLLSAVGLVVFSPLLLLAAVLIRLDSPGPALFRQWRVGRGGALFTCLKFRTMYVDADERVHRDAVRRLAAGEAISGDPRAWAKLTDDPRVTRAGRILRRASFDELPQLINVLRGEMSIVGPRPAIPYELELYENWYFERQLVKPGITGPWQVYGRGRCSFQQMMQFDVTYARTWTIWKDVKLIVLTVPRVLNLLGAY